MGQSNWEADKMLDVYIHDYMLKRQLVESAKAFMAEGNVASDPVAIDAPGGFLFEWWSVFWDIFIARTNESHSEAAATYIQTQQMKTRDLQQQAQMQQPIQRNIPLLQRDNNPSIGGPGLLSKNKGTDLGVTGLPLKGWPLTGMDQLRPNIGLQVQRPNLQSQNQFLSASHQQQIAQGHVQGNLGSSANFGFASLPRGTLNVGQPARNDGLVGSPAQSNSPRMRMAQMQQQSFQQQAQLQQQQQQQQQQQLQQNNRKRKPTSSCGPTNSTGTANTTGPSPNSPASAHTPGEGINTASSVQRTNSVPKSLMMFGANGAGGLASSSNHLDDLENFGGVGSLDDTLDSFLSPDGGDGREQYGSVKQNPTEHKAETSRGFSFGEVGCIKEPNKFTCCHFSSDGKFLASGGHDKKVILWDVETKEKKTAAEEHQHVITDVRFRPNSSQLATASFDKSVRLWDAANPNYSLDAHTGHHSPVMSLDFHPKRSDLLCFCDGGNEIQYWNISPFTCTRISKQGGSAQVRFQPRSGHVLAAASDSLVSIFDVESDRQIHLLQGHSNVINYMSWNLTGEFLATVSAESVKVWSLASGRCIHELSDSNGNQFHSCVFHPNYASSLLVVGGLRSVELWNMAENKSMTIPAHDNIVAALTQSPVNGMVASASHDNSVKLWK